MSEKPFPSNPYVTGVPLTGEAGFYGRRDMFDFIQQILEAQQQNVVVINGQRRVGKTSLLHQIARKLRAEGNVVPVYFDLQGKEQKSLGQVLHALARTVARPIGLTNPKRDKFNDSGRHFHERFLPSVKKKLGSRRLLLLFDEFDVLGDELTSHNAASETLFPYLQKLITRQRQIVFVFVVGRRIEELSTHYQSIFKQAVFRRIGLLKPNNAHDLITKPVEGVLSFEKSAIEAVLQLTSGHPYFTQLVCFETFNDMKSKNQRVVAEADILSLVNQTIESGHGALNWFWDGLPRAERFIMSAVAHVTDEKGIATQENIRQILEKHKIVLTGLELKDAPDRLTDWEMLRHEKDSGNYQFVVELVRRWILKTHSLKSARRDVDLISKRASRLYENARDAHSDGDLDYAREEYQRALNANPNHSGAQLGLAQVLFELGEIDEAIQSFERAYEIEEVSARDGLVRARQKKGKLFQSQGDEDSAIFQYEQALKIAPSNEETHIRLAAIWRKRGDEALSAEGISASFEPYQNALNYDNSETTSRPIQDNLLAYLDKVSIGDDLNEAREIYDQLGNILPGNDALRSHEISFWTQQGDALAQGSQECAEAILAYQRALELNPDDPELTKKLKAISSDWEKLLETERLFNQALVAHHQKDWTTAQEGWLNILKIDVLDYRGRNIAALLAEAHDMLIKHPSVRLELVPPAKVFVGKEVSWSITAHNDGDDKLSEVLVTLGRKRLAEPFDLKVGEKREITFTVTYNKTGKKSGKFAVIAVSSSGEKVSHNASSTVDIKEQLHPSLEVLFSATSHPVPPGTDVPWTINIHNNGNEVLTDVTASRQGTNRLFDGPFTLAPGQKKKVTFSSTYTAEGKKTIRIVVTAQTSSGKNLKRSAKASVRVQSTKTQTKAISPQLTPEKIITLLKSYQSKDNGLQSLYVLPDIPPRKLNNARRQSKVPTAEKIFGLIDCTVFGSAKNGILFGQKGIYFNNWWAASVTPGPGKLLYSEFPKRVFENKGKSTVSLGNNQLIDTSGSGSTESSKAVTDILNSLKSLIQRSR